MWLYERPVAHRGLHNETHSENSMAAFKNAIDHDYIIETDVHLLKDGEVVAFHDGATGRMCKTKSKIATLTSEDLKKEEYLLPNGEKIPLFSELLALCEERGGKILLELKIGTKGRKLEEKVYEMIKGKENFIAVQAFSPWTIKWFRKNAPEFERGLLSAPILFPLSKLVHRKLKMNFFSYSVAGASAPAMVKFVEKENLDLIVWTVRTKENLDLAIKNRVNNIIFETVDLDAEGFSMDQLAPRKEK